MSDWAKPGVRCLCVDDEPNKYVVSGWYWSGGLDGLSAGTTYTIRSVLIDRIGRPCIRVDEIIRATPSSGSYWGNSEAAYSLSRFRPLVSESDDIAMFRKIASNLPTAKELEDSVQLALERLG